MSKVFASYNSILSAYGMGSEKAVSKIKNETTSLQQYNNPNLLPDSFCASLISDQLLNEVSKNLGVNNSYTRLEKMMLAALAPVIKQADLALNDRVGLLIATTKGNIDVLEPNSLFDSNRAYLSTMGAQIKNFFGFTSEPIIISNACVSGILAVAAAKRYIQQGTYDHVFIVAGDLVTKFILSGFNSFQALSPNPCKPYCKTRTGINIGEVTASILITKDESLLDPNSVEILGEASCNDANHISGPSRTGEGLHRSVEKAIQQTKLTPSDIDFISAHGTATPFNDEMESIAFNRSGLSNTPLHSLKGYFGHTLGASGLLETIIGMHSLHQNTLYASLGFEQLGVTQPLNIIEKTKALNIKHFLKTASGFGGCNTAVIFKKIDT